MTEQTRILITTGGTAGHINPALSVAGIIRYLYPEAPILFVGTADHMEARLVPAAGFDFKTIDISGFQRSFSPTNIKRNIGTVRKLLTVSGQVAAILDSFKPDAVAGFGGYVSGPVVRLAQKRGIPTAIHEQNAFPGVTNKALAKKADAVMLASAAAADRFKAKTAPIVTGMPVRRELRNANREKCRQVLNLDIYPMVLSMGGSLGARAINDSVVGMLEILYPDKLAHFTHSYGQYGKWVPEKLAEKGIRNDPPRLVLREYIDDMPVVLPAADLVISRAGASALAELQVLGKPSILIPSPNVSENHQFHNAKALVDAGAAVLIEEKDLTPQRLAETVRSLLSDKTRLQKMSAAAKSLAHPDAAEQIFSVIDSILPS
ncbi:MAG: undecaprenyldiphospho-muramoylpentapeptide beta-N-acetylglucosaminyltransferase [Oscillospiraceae bacterium]|jgi:UDP-N-acetylglucosamine--N-acetylmuramyl-(pentapeptide) pyrophosphoryl-undecaprenol N-acetylglucosamine transferase|nr:undecaprenyldiphospho-muramoylpentapeptide beta-N-acetylglucosaminyltransferase [Oscillospiraceae bacterium]